MRKPKRLLLCFICLIYYSCGQLDDVKDTFDAADCTATLVRLNQNDDNLSCAELSTELDKLERDCREFLNDDSRANIALLKELCEDN